MLIYDLDEISSTPYSKLTVYSTAAIPHMHTFFEFAVVLEGSCKSVINNGSTKILNKGDLIFIRPNDKHVLYDFSHSYRHRDFYVTQEKMQKICHTFSDTFFNDIMAQDIPLEYHLDINEYTSLENKANIFNHTTYHNLVTEEYLNYIHTSIISNLIGIIIYSRVSINDIVPDWLKKMFLHLSSYHYTHLTIEDIIKKTGYSYSYVYSMFKKYYGTTLLDCLNKSKVILSTGMLGESKIIDIALSLGWENPKNYTIAFKKVFGMTPQKYLSTKRKNEKQPTKKDIVYPQPPKHKLADILSSGKDNINK